MKKLLPGDGWIELRDESGKLGGRVHPAGLYETQKNGRRVVFDLFQTRDRGRAVVVLREYVKSRA